VTVRRDEQGRQTVALRGSFPFLCATSLGEQGSTAVTHEHTDDQASARDGQDPYASQAGSAGSIAVTRSCRSGGRPPEPPL
jgi:hypothetical protein